MTRRGPRRQVLDLLRQPTERLKWLKEQWTVTSTVWLLDEEREPGSNVRRRPRQPGEYPENDPAAWQAVRDQAYAAAAELVALADFAGEQLAALTARQKEAA